MCGFTWLGWIKVKLAVISFVGPLVHAWVTNIRINMIGLWICGSADLLRGRPLLSVRSWLGRRLSELIAEVLAPLCGKAVF